VRAPVNAYWSGETVRVTKQGDRRITDHRLAATESGSIVCTAQDITGERTTASTQHGEFYFLFEGKTSAFYTLDHEGYVTRWNDRVEDVLGVFDRSQSRDTSRGTPFRRPSRQTACRRAHRGCRSRDGSHGKSEVPARRREYVHSHNDRRRRQLHVGRDSSRVRCRARIGRRTNDTPRSGQSASLTPRDDDPDFLIRAEPHMPPSLSVESGSVSVSIRGVRRAGRPLESVLECRR